LAAADPAPAFALRIGRRLGDCFVGFPERALPSASRPVVPVRLYAQAGGIDIDRVVIGR
jgi:hypothetical protein